MTINPKSNPQDAIKVVAKLIQSNNWDKATKLTAAVIQHQHFDYGLKLAKYVSKVPITPQKSEFLTYLSKLYISANKMSYLKEIAKSIIDSTGNKSDPTFLKIKALLQNANQSNQEEASKRLGNVDIYSLSTKGNIQQPNSFDQPDSDSITSNEKDAFKNFYQSFLTDSIKSLLVSSESGSNLGKYYVHITKEYIDFHKVEGQYHKKYMYDFNSHTLTINNESKPDSVLKNFYKMMDVVSKDVKHNRATLMQESF